MENRLPQRKPMRLKGYDYSQAGYYFLTICIKDRQKLLGQIVGDAALGVPRMELSSADKMVEGYINNINRQSGVRLDKYVIMPNHIHLLLCVRASTDHGTPRAAPPTKASVPRVVNALKGLTSKKFGETLWQRTYYDHIIRDEADYQCKWQYIDENIFRWKDDEYCRPQDAEGGVPYDGE